MLTWPKGAQLPKSQERDTIAATAAATLGMGNAKRTWQFTGPHLRLRLVPPVPPPRLVTLEDIKRAILDADDDCLILGIGEDGKVVSRIARLCDRRKRQTGERGCHQRDGEYLVQ